MAIYYEFTERELAGLHDENTGADYIRLNRIKDRIMQARIDAALQFADLDMKDLNNG